MDLVTEEDSKSGAEVAAEMAASGALDEIFARIDAGEIELTGAEGLIPGLIKAALERGLQAELTDHLGYERGDPEASVFANSRNGSHARRRSRPRSATSSWRSRVTGTARSPRGWSRRAHAASAGSTR